MPSGKVPTTRKEKLGGLKADRLRGGLGEEKARVRKGIVVVVRGWRNKGHTGECRERK